MLIFLPHKRGASPTHLVDAGLGHLLRLDDNRPVQLDLPDAGPGGTAGQLLAWIDDAAAVQAEQVGYFPPQPGQTPRQTWLPGANGRYWVGWQNDLPPTPANLQRRTLVDGPVTTLGDGQEWQLIAAANLPQQARLVEGKWAWAPQTRFASFVERSAWAFDVARQALEAERAIPLEAVEYALGVLSWNYRIVPEVADWLGLFTAETLLRTLVLTTDVNRLREIVLQLKKGGSPPTPTG